MSYQFIHISAYSRFAPKKKSHEFATKLTVSNVISEVIRLPGHHPHVRNPHPPIVIWGSGVANIESKCEEWAKETKDAKGRCARKDALCLLAGVFSMQRDTTPQPVWEKTKRDAVDWLLSKYGDRLETVIEHTDEAQLHCHFFVVPRPGERFDSLHEGLLAAREAKSKGLGRKEQNFAYRASMREFQDEYYKNVGAPNGMVRVGPARRRLTRQQWVAEKFQAEAVSRQVEQAESARVIARAALVAATAKIDGLREVIEEESLRVMQVAQTQATAERDHARSEAEKIGMRAGREAALISFQRSSLWAKIGALLSCKDTKIARLEAGKSELSRKLAAASSQAAWWKDEAQKFRRLHDEKLSLFKAVRRLVAGLRKDRDQAMQLHARTLIQIRSLRERESQFRDMAADREQYRARADLAERMLSSYRARDALPVEPRHQAYRSYAGPSVD